MNPKALCAPVLLALLLLSGAGRAQEPSTKPDERLVEGSPDGLSPQHHALLERRLNSQRVSAKPKLKGRIPDAVLAQARKVCDSEGNQEVNSLDVARYCFTCTLCGYRGSRGGTQCISRERPDHMAFVETAGLHVDSGESYPVHKAGSAQAGAAAALTVHAYTLGHVSWGLDHWRDAKDLSLAWQAMRVGEDLRFHAEVEDDVLQPVGEGPAVHADHLEFDFEGPRAHLKLGVLLAADGQVKLRLWKQGAPGQVREVDEEYAGAGTWSKTERGYRVEVSLPLVPLREALGPLKTYRFGMVACDADEKKRQETLLGNSGSLDFWDEYPPSIEEYNLVRVGR